MKALIAAAALVAFLCETARAQALTPPDLTPQARKASPPLTLPDLRPVAPTPASPFPNDLKATFGVLNGIYPKLDGKKRTRSPADSAWLLRSNNGGIGTLEVGFQGADIVYMIFRRGVGGTPWNRDEIEGMHRLYSNALLKEDWVGKLFSHAVGVPNSAAYIYRKDFDVSSLMGGL